MPASTRRVQPEMQSGEGQCSDADDSVGELYERYAAHIAAYALRRTASADAGDVVAETFLIAWRKRDQIPEEPMSLPWLYGVARRVVANNARSHRRRTRLHARLTSHSHRAQAPSTYVEVAEGFERVGAALRKLSADDAEVLRLTAWEDLSPTEIASVLGLEPAAVRQRLHRARKRLRKHLEIDEPIYQPALASRPFRSQVHKPIAGAPLGTLGFGGGGHHV